MKILLDTNVLLDYLLNRDGADSAITLLQLGNAHCLDVLVTDLTIANIAYITRKQISKEDFYRVMKRLTNILLVVPIGGNVVQTALNARWGDFEDCLQYFAAVQAGTDCIITRNESDYIQAQIPICTPEEFITSLNQ